MAAESDNRKSTHAAERLEHGESINVGSLSDPTSDLEIFAKEVLGSLISDNLPPTPNNFALYFDRILENKSESLRHQIGAILELEEDNNDEQSLELEKSLKQGFSSIKSMLQVGATLYKNMGFMDKILEKKREEIQSDASLSNLSETIHSLSNDVGKLSGILKKQVTHIKTIYDETATIVKNVENETIFDNQYGVYNKRYMITKLTQEVKMIEEFNHNSSLIMVQLSNDTAAKTDSEKARQLMNRTIARLLLKTSRRSDIIAHYGEGIFGMLLKHTDIDNAKRAADRLHDLVSTSNFFIGEQEVQLMIAIGITPLESGRSIEEMIASTLDAMQASQDEKRTNYVVSS